MLGICIRDSVFAVPEVLDFGTYGERECIREALHTLRSILLNDPYTDTNKVFYQNYVRKLFYVTHFLYLYNCEIHPGYFEHIDQIASV